MKIRTYIIYIMYIVQLPYNQYMENSRFLDDNDITKTKITWGCMKLFVA